MGERVAQKDKAIIAHSCKNMSPSFATAARENSGRWWLVIMLLVPVGCVGFNSIPQRPRF